MMENQKRRIALKIAYDGTAYAGWQRQETGLGIQAVLEDTIAKQFSEKVHVMGSGRTDAGVHAEGQVAAFDFHHPIPAESLVRALNANLPDDIRILDAMEVDGDFQPQYGAKRKTYVYRFLNGPVMLPNLRYHTVLVPEKLDMERMKEALPVLEGEHDFYAFRSAKAENASTVRTIYEASLSEAEDLVENGTVYELKVTGNGFLYNMVRIIAGTLIEVGRGAREPEDVARILQARDRRAAGPTAPAAGLILVSYQFLEDPHLVCPAEKEKEEKQEMPHAPSGTAGD